MRRVSFLCSVFLFFVVFSSCKDDSNPVNKIEDIVFPAKNISYKRTIQPLFNIACAVPGCHSFEDRKGNIDLTSYEALKLAPNLVVAGKPELSRLTKSVEAWYTPNGTNPMPPYRALTSNQVTGLKQWITEGATDTIP